MPALRPLVFLLRLSDAVHIARRYFITNGFDGALTMLGLVTGFRLTDIPDIETAMWASVGTAVALSTSGFSSAYMSESAERKKALRELEDAMAGRSLGDSAHGRAARLAPLFVALVNGGAPLLFALLIALPLWLGWKGVPLPLPPLDSAIVVAFAEIALLGAFLGRISDSHWLWMSIKTLVVAAVTVAIILFLGH